MSNEDTLISKLIEETYTESVEKDQSNPVVDLRNYFEKKLNEVDFNSISDYLDQNHLSHQSLDFLKHIGCYRIILKQMVLDFPSNWSIFSKINESNLVYVDPSLDRDFLLDIFTEINGSSQNLALINDNNQVELVFLPSENSKEHVKWINSYFEKKVGTSEKKISA